jgi:uncharacterized protein with GYD domain
MSLFIRLATMTEKAVANIERLDKMLADARGVMSEEGARILNAYATLGTYDIIAVIEAPSAEAAARLSARIAAQGNFRSETLAATPLEDFVKSVSGRA